MLGWGRLRAREGFTAGVGDGGARFRSAPRARGVHSLNFHDGIPISVGSARARGSPGQVGTGQVGNSRLRAREGFTNTNSHNIRLAGSAPRARGVLCGVMDDAGTPGIGSTHEKGSRGTGWPSGLPGRMRGPVTRQRPSVTLSGHSCHDARPLVTGVSGSCHSPT